ncbi:MAG TPA: ribosome biogenesis GTPase YlqF [Pseudogracilibacillus sp.]|nr:ribosome biogenesis GTPase YlqF [Pseudogracilibacillus sp.]
MIQWYPGHMAKAKREIEQSLRHVDVVIELVDARIPKSSQNPLLQEIIGEKVKIIALMKRDLADESKTKQWLESFEKQSLDAISIDANNERDINELVELVYEKGLEAQRRLLDRGVKERPIRALIVGIPNVGKSTLINRLANKRIAKIGDRPGITKMQQWIKVRGKFELLDTPGVLWPKFESEEIGLKLAAIGSIKYDLTPEQDVAAFLIQYALEHYEELFLNRFPIEEREDMWVIFEEIGRLRGALESGGHVNFDKVATIVLQDFRTGKIGSISLE